MITTSWLLVVSGPVNTTSCGFRPNFQSSSVHNLFIELRHRRQLLDHFRGQKRGGFSSPPLSISRMTIRDLVRRITLLQSSEHCLV